MREATNERSEYRQYLLEAQEELTEARNELLDWSEGLQELNTIVEGLDTDLASAFGHGAYGAAVAEALRVSESLSGVPFLHYLASIGHRLGDVVLFVFVRYRVRFPVFICRLVEHLRNADTLGCRSECLTGSCHCSARVLIAILHRYVTVLQKHCITVLQRCELVACHLALSHSTSVRVQCSPWFASCRILSCWCCAEASVVHRRSHDNSESIAAALQGLQELSAEVLRQAKEDHKLFGSH